MSTVTKPTGQRPSHRPDDPISLGSLSDVDLLEAWRRDQYAPALATLVERYSVMVLSVCRRRCRSVADAEDAYQTTFLYLARNSRKIRRPECLPGWLQRVAQRASIATLSSSKRETEPMVEPPTDPDDPLERLTQRHEAIVLDEELADLPEHYRAAIVMHWYEDCPLQSLAEHFGTTVGSIRGRLQRGKQLLAQRLRRRGVVPVIAFAAAEAWKVTDVQASQAAEQFIDSTSAGGELPEPPVDTHLLESLLSQGVRLMPSLYTALGLIGGSALIAAMMTTDGNQSLNAQSLNAQSSGRQQVMSIPGEVVGQFGADVVVQMQSQAAGADTGSESGSPPAVTSGGGGMGGMGGMSGGGMGGGYPGPGNPNTQWAQRAVAPKPTGPLANTIMARLDSEVALNLSTTLADLPQALAAAVEMPVLLDERGIAFAKQSPSTAVEFTGSQPLRTTLRRVLGPMGLQAVVAEEGLVITADPSALVHQGVGVNRWINIDEDAEKAISEKLAAETKVEFEAMPLRDLVAYLNEEQGLAAIIDDRALEEIGLSPDEPISFSSQKISCRNFLALALRIHDLTYTIEGETLVITTEEEAEQSLVSRIYWLEGTGFAGTDYDSVFEAIQSSITPDTWEALGGPSTIVALHSARPGIVVSTTYTVHQTIERFFEAVRETHFGAEPVLERIQVPATSPAGFQGGGFGGGGGMF